MDKLCNTCQETKPSTSFGKDKSTKDGLMRACRPCWNARCKRIASERAAKELQERKAALDAEGTEWRDVAGYADYYAVSADGRVLSKRRMAELVPIQKPIGYFVVSLVDEDEKKQVLIHRLVAEAFIPNPEGKPFVNHKDGNKANPHASNLEWVTAKENSQHAWETGLSGPNHKRGEQVPNAKLTEANVIDIRTRYGAGEATLRDLAAEFGVCRYHLRDIASRKRWKHVA